MRLDRLVCCFAVLTCSAPALVRAQGFQLNEIGGCAVGRGLAVTGAPCKDPSMIYWNPGATTSLPGWSAYLGLTAVDVNGDFTADATGRVDRATVPTSFPAHFFLNHTSKSGRWAVGVGAYVPYGLTSQWSPDFAGRFEAQKASLASIYFQPNLAYRFARGWSIGGGPVFGYSQVQLRRALDLAQQSVPGTPFTFGQLGVAGGTEFATVRVEGSGTAWGFNAGLHGQITPDLEFGVRYLTQLTFDYSGADAVFNQVPTNLVLPDGNPLGLPAGTPVDGLLSAQFAPGGALAPQTASTRIKHPAQLEAGLGYSGLLNTLISADVEWTQFSSFASLPLTFVQGATRTAQVVPEDYINSWSVRAGVEHAFAIGIKGRAGFSYVRSPAPDVTVTPLLPDMNRRNYTLGLGVPLTPHYTLDAAYLHVDTSGRRGRVVERLSTAQTAAELNSGFYELSANTFSLSIRANY